MSKLLLWLLIVYLFCFNPQPALAHTLGGPPFLKINNRYAQNNPYYQGSTTLNIPQDDPPEPYLVGKPVILEVDRDRLAQQTAIPSDFARKLTFRWVYAQGKNFEKTRNGYQYGNKITYTFSAPRSYLITVEARSPLDSNYIIIDTVQINVLPALSYKTPVVSVFVGTQSEKADSPVLLVSQTTFDPSAKNNTYFWDFDDGKLYPGMSMNRNFSTINSFGIGIIFHRAVDENGFSQDIGFHVENIKNKLQFAPFGNMTKIPVRYGSIEHAQALLQDSEVKPQKKSGMEVYVVFVILGIIIFALACWLMHAVKQSKK